MKTIVSNVTVSLYCYKRTNELTNLDTILEERRALLQDLGISKIAKAGGNENWHFYEKMTFSPDRFDKIEAVIKKHQKLIEQRGLDMGVEMDCIFERELVGKVEFGNKVRISDPCYSMDTWCALTLDVLPGTYNLYVNKTYNGRTANMWAIHNDFIDYSGVEIVEGVDETIGVDSGLCGIYELPYFESHGGQDGDWYEGLIDLSMPAVLDDAAFICSSGYGDGGYTCYVTKDINGSIFSINIPFIFLE